MKEIKIGGKIQFLRSAFGYSQEEVAKHLGIPRASISQIESDGRNLSVTELLLLSDMFNIDMRFLLVSDLKGVKAQYVNGVVSIPEHKHYLDD